MGIAALKTKAQELKKNIVVLYLAFKHPKTPLLAKIVIGIVVSYALSPIDLIPDFVPVLGYIDDLILIPAGIAIALKLIPAEVLMECRERQNSLSVIKKNGVYAAILIVLIWLFILYLFLFHCF